MNRQLHGADLRVLDNGKDGKQLVLANSGAPVPAIPWKAGMKIDNANGNVGEDQLGYDYTIQTTTFIRQDVVKQKFYEEPPADYMPIIVGNGAWMESIKTNVQFEVAGAFDAGYMSTTQSPGMLDKVDVATAPINAPIYTWAKSYGYSVPEANKALAYNQWNVVAGKMETLKRHADLGLQKKLFLGKLGDLANCPGLLSNASVTVNTSLITQSISSMSYTQFQALVAGLLAAYWENSNKTSRKPNMFVMPMNDFLGLGGFVNPQFPTAESTMLAVLTKVFRDMTGVADFQVLGTAYGEQAANAGYWTTLGTNRYALYKKDKDVLKVDIPVQPILTPAVPVGPINFEGALMLQHSGCWFYRPAEGLYFDW